MFIVASLPDHPEGITGFTGEATGSPVGSGGGISYTVTLALYAGYNYDFTLVESTPTGDADNALRSMSDGSFEYDGREN
jgi:hypothetical protein